MIHNYLQIGQVAFDAPFQYKVIASQYAYTGNLDINNFDFEGKGLGRVLTEFVLKEVDSGRVWKGGADLLGGAKEELDLRFGQCGRDFGFKRLIEVGGVHAPIVARHLTPGQ